MSTVPLPSPEEAARLRALYDDNHVVQHARVALFGFGGNLTAEEAAALLPMWKHYRELTEREAQAVVAFLMPRADDPDDSRGWNSGPMGGGS